MKKRLLSLLLAFLLCLSLLPAAALGEAEPAEEPIGEPAAEPAAEPAEEPAADGLQVYDVETGDSWADITLPYGAKKTLRVGIDTDDQAGVTYQWSFSEYDVECGAFVGGEPIEGAVSAEYTFTAERHVLYSCIVMDSKGNSDEVHFYIIIENHLRAFDPETGRDNAEVSVVSGGDAILKATATADDDSVFTYGWYRLPGQQLLSTEQTYTVKDVTEAQRYFCAVGDRYGNRANVYFDVVIGNGLNAEPVGSNLISVPLGDSAAMAVTATANEMTGLTYQWCSHRIDENGNSWNDPIEGATGPSYTVENVTAAAEYCCVVKDKYGTEKYVWFYINVDSGLKVWAKDSPWQAPWDEITVEKGEGASLAVETNADDPSLLTFTWYEMIPADEPNTWSRGGVVGHGDSYETGEVVSVKRFLCIVCDDYGTEYEVDFTVRMNNHFQMHAEQDIVLVNAGGDAELKVIAQADTPVTYQWFRGFEETFEGGSVSFIDYEQSGRIDGETASVLKVKNVRETAYYVCEVSDGYETRCIDFTVGVDIGLEAYAAGTQDAYAVVHVLPGERATLAVDAHVDEGELTYTWYQRTFITDEGGYAYPVEQAVPGADGSSITTDPVNGSAFYECRVTDSNGSDRRVTFDVYVEDHFSIEIVGEEGLTVMNNPYFPSSMPIRCVFAVPGEPVELAVKVESDAAKEGKPAEVVWYAYSDDPDGGGPVGAGETLALSGVARDTLLYASAENAYGESEGLYFMILSLDADTDGDVDATDAAGFLSREENETDCVCAVKVLQRLAGVGE